MKDEDGYPVFDFASYGGTIFEWNNTRFVTV
jgi:hypothetical protein